MKMTMEKRLEIAKEYFSDKTSITKLVKKYDTEKGKVQYYVRLYELHGGMIDADATSTTYIYEAKTPRYPTRRQSVAF